MRTNLLRDGEPAPWFTTRTRTNERYVFDTVAGRYVVLSFFESSSHPAAQRLLDTIRTHRQRFDDDKLCFFGVSVDALDEKDVSRVEDMLPGIRFFFDTDGAIGPLYGVRRDDDAHQLVTYLLDPMLRVCTVWTLRNGVETHLANLISIVDKLPRNNSPRIAAMQAPILVLPRVFEPKLCRALVDYYQGRGGEESGAMREIDNRTVNVIEYRHKRRRDCRLEDDELRRACMNRVHARICPEIWKAFQFRVTRMERYIVACYDFAEGGHFRPHRDNTTKGTAHRRFAVSVFLNSGEYEGGFLRFPEFGPELYSAPVGGAVVFSCSLLHEATPVTQGQRFVFLPFLYDEEARRLREDNFKFLDEELRPPGF